MQGSYKSVINISCVPKPSPFRYPGGKSWLIPHVRRWLRDLESPIHFAEPFAGGANVGLTVAIEKLADRVTLVELDGVAVADKMVTLRNDALPHDVRVVLGTKPPA